MKKSSYYVRLLSTGLFLFLVTVVAALLLIKVERTVEAPGEVRIGRYQIVRPQVTGIIGNVLVESGATVSPGQTLCILVDYEFEKQRASVLQQITEALSRQNTLSKQRQRMELKIHPLEKARQIKLLASDRLEHEGVGYRTREAAVELRRAEEKLERMQELGESGLASKQAINEAEFDKQQAELRLARSRIDERFAEDKREMSSDDYRLLEAEQDRNLATVDAELEQLEILLDQLKAQQEQMVKLSSFYELRAETHGLVIGARAQELRGRKVQAGEEIFSIIDTASVQFVAQVPDAAIVKVRPGQPVQVEFTGLPKHDFDLFLGRISQVSQEPQLTEKASEIRYPVEISLTDPFVLWEGNRFYLRNGMRGIAKISYRSNVRLVQLIYEIVVGDQAGGSRRTTTTKPEN